MNVQPHSDDRIDAKMTDAISEYDPGFASYISCGHVQIWTSGPVQFSGSASSCVIVAFSVERTASVCDIKKL